MPENLIISNGNAFGAIVGSTLARTITEQLGIRLQFPDKTAELQELAVLTGALPGLEISELELAQILQSEETAITKAAQEARLSEHDTMLAKSKILTRDADSQDEGSYMWQAAATQSASKFADVLDEIRISLQPKHTDETPREPSISESIELEMVSLLEARVSTMLEDLMNNIPLPTTPNVFRKVGQLAAKVVGHPAGEPYYREFKSPKRQDIINSRKEPVNVSRKTRELNRLLSELTDDPHGFLVHLYIENQRSELEQQAVTSLDEQIVGASRPYVAAKQVGRRALRRQRPEIESSEQYVPVTQVKVGVDANSTAEVVIKGHEEVLEMLGTFNFSMPWMPGGETTSELMKLTRDDKMVYVSRGLIPKLQAISEKSRPKVSVTTTGVNQFDAIALHMARSIASGVMPYQNNNLRQLLPSTKRPPYDTIPVWFPFDISPNAPRFYFTVEKMGELMDMATNGEASIDKDSYCVVVLAETDKVNQLDVLNTLTKGTRRHMRVRGSGSI